MSSGVLTCGRLEARAFASLTGQTLRLGRTLVQLQRQLRPEPASRQLRGMLPRLLAEMVRVITCAFGAVGRWAR